MVTTTNAKIEKIKGMVWGGELPLPQKKRWKLLRSCEHTPNEFEILSAYICILM